MSDTIVAIATPPGLGAIGIIRLSGKDAFTVAESCFQGKKLSNQASHTAHFGRIVETRHDEKILIDEVVATIFKNPTSYTGEDVVEISCHGSPYILQKILQLFMENGARLANPGEFTLRAFLHGKMDLSQAEAVADLIASDSQASHAVAMKQMRGGFSKDIQVLRQELVDFAALLELELDFSEEDVEFADREKLLKLIATLQQTIGKLLHSFKYGNAIKSGIATVIAGRPNAGKSTLLNALLNEDRAIVSDIAGTTRDTIEESMYIQGVQFRFVDTAGIRKSKDAIEEVGVSKALQEIKKAKLVLYVVDPETTTPDMVQQDISQLALENNTCLLLFNKMDLHPGFTLTDYQRTLSIRQENSLEISALNKVNIEVLKEKIYQHVFDQEDLWDQTIVANSRHYEALFQTNASLESVIHGIHSGISNDFIAMDLRQALFHLGTITGEISNEDLLDSIFTRFCIGK